MFRSLYGRDLHGHVPPRPLWSREQNGSGQCSWPRARLDDHEVVGLAEAEELGMDPVGEDCTEERSDLRRGDEVTTATCLTARCVEAALTV